MPAKAVVTNENGVWVIRLSTEDGKVQEYRCASEAQARQLVWCCSPTPRAAHRPPGKPPADLQGLALRLARWKHEITHHQELPDREDGDVGEKLGEDEGNRELVAHQHHELAVHQHSHAARQKKPERRFGQLLALLLEGEVTVGEEGEDRPDGHAGHGSDPSRLAEQVQAQKSRPHVEGGRRGADGEAAGGPRVVGALQRA